MNELSNAPASGALPGHPSRGRSWLSRVISALPILMMLFSAALKFARSPEVIEAFSGKFGYPPGTIVPIGIAEITCVVLYAIPQTAVLGAVLMSAYLGGAVATHARVGDPFVAPALLGILAWLGLYLRDDRVRALLPLRRPPG